MDLFQSLCDECAVLSHQRHDIRYRAQRHQVQILLDIRPALFELLKKCHHQFIRQPYSGNMIIGIHLIVFLLADNGNCRRHGFTRQVMIGQDHIHPKLLRQPYFFAGADAAIHRDQYLCTQLRQAADRIQIQAIAFRKTIRDIGLYIRTQFLQRLRKQRCAGDAIHIEITVHHHFLMFPNGLFDALHRAGNIAQ